MCCTTLPSMMVPTTSRRLERLLKGTFALASSGARLQCNTPPMNAHGLTLMTLSTLQHIGDGCRAFWRVPEMLTTLSSCSGARRFWHLPAAGYAAGADHQNDQDGDDGVADDNERAGGHAPTVWRRRNLFRLHAARAGSVVEMGGFSPVSMQLNPAGINRDLANPCRANSTRPLRSHREHVKTAEPLKHLVIPNTWRIHHLLQNDGQLRRRNRKSSTARH